MNCHQLGEQTIHSFPKCRFDIVINQDRKLCNFVSQFMHVKFPNKKMASKEYQKKIKNTK